MTLHTQNPYTQQHKRPDKPYNTTLEVKQSFCLMHEEVRVTETRRHHVRVAETRKHRVRVTETRK